MRTGQIDAAIWTVVSDVRCTLGEGPVWDDRRKRLFWVDIEKGTIHCFDTTNGQHRAVTMNQKTGAVVLKESGGMIVAMKDALADITESAETVEIVARLSPVKPRNRFNDGKCDPAGRFWVGTMDEVDEETGAGSLYMYTRAAGMELKVQAVSCSNGLAWTADARTMYYIDSPTKKVVAFDFEINTGAITNKRTVIMIPEGEGFPDGMTIDDEGMLWIAHWDGWKISRWDPRSGTKLQEMHFPVARITSCCFGGETMEDIYVTSASINLAEDARKAQPLAGALFVIKNSGYKGLPASRFAG